MSAKVIAFLLGMLVAPAAYAQSTITLDTIDVGDSGAVEEMRDCLFDDGSCSSTEYGGSVEITLDDVVNLGVVDRSDVPAPDLATRAAATPLASIDLEIMFAYNSADLSPLALMKLADLQRALSDPRFGNQRLVFIGHTDAVGGAAYNLELSQRRAEAVARYVQALTGLPAERISAVGVGFTRLKNQFNPAAAENRRVQFVLVPMS